jgi:putative PEP-CTERM system TPR-repeat lipoprotein
MEITMKKKLVLSSVAFALLLAGCGGSTPEQSVLKAESFIEQKQYNSAVIELKSALQDAPTHFKARSMLATIYLQTGNGLAAEKEFLQALTDGAPIQDIALPLIQAAYLAGKLPDSKVIDVNNPALASVKPYYDLYRVWLTLDEGELNAIAEPLAPLLTLTEPHDVKLVASALEKLLANEALAALELLAKLPENSVLYTDSLLLKGKIELVANRKGEAIKSLTQYNAKNLNSNIAKLLLAEVLIQEKFANESDKIILPLLKAYPEQPMANFIKAMIEYERKNYAEAKERAEKAISNGMDAVNVRILAALAAVGQGLNSQAMAHLETVKHQLGAFPPIQKLYATLLLQQGQTDSAQAMLTAQPASEADIQLLSSATYRLLQQGKTEQAKALVEHLEKSLPDNANNMAVLGMLQLNFADKDKAIADLEQAVKLDPSIDQNRYLLVMGYLGKGEFAKAEQTAQIWLTKDSSKALGHAILAYTALLQDNADKAKTELAKALAANPKDVLALLLKARLDMLDNKPEEAKKSLWLIVDTQSDFVPALENLYALSRQSADAAKVVTAIEKGLADRKENVPLRLLLGRVYADLNQHAKILPLLQPLEADEATAPELYWLLKIDAHEQLKQTQQALTEAQNWVKKQSFSDKAKLLLAKQWVANGQLPNALPLVDELMKQRPDDLPLKGYAIMLYAENGDTSKALSLLDGLPAAEQTKADTLYLRGRVLATAKRYDEALKVYLDSYAKVKSPKTALLIANMYQFTQGDAKAREFLTQHLATEPKEINIVAMYGNLLISSAPDQAIENFKLVLEQDPNNILALNNLAYLHANAGKFADAETYGQQALKLAPKHPDILDTNGMILLKQNKFSDARGMFEQSLQIRPDHTEVQLNYIETLLGLGDKDKAALFLDKVKTTDATLLKRKEALAGRL